MPGHRRDVLVAENHEPVRVAINVMRARITVVGFNVAIISFQIGLVRQISGGIALPGVETELHLQAMVALFMGLALSVVALISFILSGAIDHEGSCGHWSLLVGDLFMYLGLAHGVAGFFGPFTGEMGRLAVNLPDHGADMASLRIAVVIAGGGAWFLATYLGPIVSLIRSPFPRSVTRAIAGVYLAMLLALAWVSGQAARLEAGIAQAEPERPPLVVEFVQPLRW
jgi:hypothetical protein